MRLVRCRPDTGHDRVDVSRRARCHSQRAWNRGRTLHKKDRMVLFPSLYRRLQARDIRFHDSRIRAQVLDDTARVDVHCRLQLGEHDIERFGFVGDFLVRVRRLDILLPVVVAVGVRLMRKPALATLASSVVAGYSSVTLRHARVRMR